MSAPVEAPPRERLEGWFRVVAFVVLAAVGALATLQTYLALQASLSLWLQPQWVPLGQAAFGLAVLAVVVWLLRAFVLARRA